MHAAQLRRFLFPDEAERDPGFRQEIFRLSHLGLRILGWSLLSVPLFITLARVALNREPSALAATLGETAVLALLGGALLLAARAETLYPWSRAIALAAVVAVSAILTGFSLRYWHIEGQVDGFVASQAAVLLLLAVASIPVRPVQALQLGLLLGLFYVGAAFFSQALFGLPHSPEPLTVVCILAVTIVGTLLTGVIYQQRYGNYSAYIQTLGATADIRKVQHSALVSENAASLGRLAAALSHELNSPLGALSSAVDTLLLVSAKQASDNPLDRERFLRLEANMRRAIQESLGRLKEIVHRMQRFTNLDRAEILAVNLNDLLSDIAALLDPHIRAQAELKMELTPIPELVCRPQQLGAVFRGLLDNAMNAASGGHVTLSTRRADGSVEVRIRDSGRGMDRETARNIFDPGFKISGGLVSTGNWSMFSARQIIQEHGGSIRFDSAPGEGATVTVTLPLRETESGL